jgi:hypothetical protein
MSDPKRLLDATSGSSTVRTLLEAAHVSAPNFEPPAGMAEAQWNALEAKLAANAGSTSASTSPQSPLLRHLPKLGGAVIASALILGGFFALQQRLPDTNTKPSHVLPAVELQTVTAVPAPIVIAPAHEARGVTPDSLPLASVTVHSASKSAALPSASVSSESPGAELEEAASVRDARRALRQGNASDALSILASYDKAHRTGMLLQERSFLRIEALSLKADARVETEAAAFLKAFPSSPYADRVRAMKH